MNNNANAPKFAFYYILSLVALIFTAISVGIVIFQIINKNISDIINQFAGSFEPEALKFAISALIIAAPIYYVIQSIILKNLYKGDLDQDSAIRKWLTYFILLVSSVVMIVWLIITINSFLDGDLTTKFILKALTAIGISALIFSFYLYDIRRDKVKNEKNKIISIYFYGSLVLVIGAFIFAILNVESPTETRKRKLDEMVLAQFDQIVNATTLYYKENESLPESLSQLENNYDFKVESSITDPETKEQFDYRIIEDKKFELCANFRLSNQEKQTNSSSYYQNRWPHDAGHVCFEQSVIENDQTKTIPEIRTVPVQ